MTAAEALSDGRAAYLEAVESLLVAAVPCDVALYNMSEVSSGNTSVEGRFAQEYRWVEPVVAAFAGEHPIVRAFVRPGRHDAVCRISDEVDNQEFLNSRIFSELYHPMGARHQVAVLTAHTTAELSPAVPGPALTPRICGWVLNRGTSDFTDSEKALLRGVERSLAVLDPSLNPSPTAASPVPSLPIQQLSHPLTPRELEVLELLGQGFTAGRIGRLLRISPETVRKHLGHIYEKFGTHDRLLTIRKAQAAGLLA